LTLPFSFLEQLLAQSGPAQFGIFQKAMSESLLTTFLEVHDRLRGKDELQKCLF